jgi:hypothetical protein
MVTPLDPFTLPWCPALLPTLPLDLGHFVAGSNTGVTHGYPAPGTEQEHLQNARGPNNFMQGNSPSHQNNKQMCVCAMFSVRQAPWQSQQVNYFSNPPNSHTAWLSSSPALTNEKSQRPHRGKGRVDARTTMPSCRIWPMSPHCRMKAISELSCQKPWEEPNDRAPPGAHKGSQVPPPSSLAVFYCHQRTSRTRTQQYHHASFSEGAVIEPNLNQDSLTWIHALSPQDSLYWAGVQDTCFAHTRPRFHPQHHTHTEKEKDSPQPTLALVSRHLH